MKNNIKDNPYCLMAVLLVLWGLFAGLSKIIMRTLDSYQLQFYMFGSAAVVMTVILGVNGGMRKLIRLSKKDFLLLLLYSLPSFAYYFTYTLALRHLPAIEASMINYTFPIMIVLFAVPINGEKLDVWKLMSILLGIIGVIVIITNGSFWTINLTNLGGDLLALAAAVSWGLFSSLGKRNKVNIFLSNYIFTLVSFLLSSIALMFFSNFAIPDVFTAAGLFWLGMSNIVLSYYIWFRALKIASSALIASMSFITPFVTLIFIMLLTGERISFIQILGFIIILSGVAVQNLVKFIPSFKIARNNNSID